MVDCDMIPVVEVFFRSLDEFQFLFGVINESAEFSLLCLTQRCTKEFANFAFDITGCVFQNVLECLVFSMKISQEMLSTFGQVEDSLEIDDLCTGVGHRGEGLCQQLQVSYVEFLIVVHNHWKICVKKKVLWNV